MVDRSLADGGRVLVIGDWISNFSYAVWDGSSLSLKRYDLGSGESE